MYKVKQQVIFAMCTVALLMISCTGGSNPQYGFNVEYERSAFIRIGSGSERGAAPHEVHVYVSIGGAHTDDASQSKGKKIELDFGAGEGWQDVTVTVHALLSTEATLNGSGVPQSEWLSYTYIEPGQYQIWLRVTWWDGEVTPGGNEATTHVITVTAPE